MTMLLHINLENLLRTENISLIVESLCFYLFWSPQNILDNEEEGAGLNFRFYFKTQYR